MALALASGCYHGDSLAQATEATAGSEGSEGSAATGDTLPTTGSDDETGETPEERQSGGRNPRRLSVDQVRASLQALLGQTYRGGAWVYDPLDPQGEAWREDADLLDAFAGALGRPDYNYTVSEALEAGMTFAKFVQDAARSTCRAAVEADIAAPADARHLLLSVDEDDTLASAEPAIRGNVATLALRFWGRELAPDSPEVDELIAVFAAAAAAPEWVDDVGTTRPAGTPADGWRAVCIALVADGQFYVY
jgi:hypothetical protein